MINRYTVEDLERLKALYDSGLTYAQIGEIENLVGKTIKYHLNKINVKSRIGAKPIEIDMDKVLNLRRQGLKTKEIAKLLNVSLNSLYRRGLTNEPLNPNSIHTYKKDLDFFKVIDTELKAYYLGLIMSDGSVNDKGDLRIELKSVDAYILCPLRDALSPDSNIREYTRLHSQGKYTWESTTSTLYIKAKAFVSDLSMWGVTPNKSYKDLRLPNIPEHLLRHFIRGIFDGDGCVYLGKKNKRITVTITGSFTLLEDIRTHLITVDIANTSAVRKKPHQADSVWTMCPTSHIKAFMDYIYTDSTIYLHRKKDIFTNYFILPNTP